ncbi:pyridoxal-phosphate dependent enzyme [Echinicola sediminis]
MVQKYRSIEKVFDNFDEIKKIHALLAADNIPTTPIFTPENSPFDVNVYVKRLDLIHPLVSGNKFFKLKYNLMQAKEQGFKTVLTFGGAFSNHIYATAAAAKANGFQSIGIIRGEAAQGLNPTLRFAKESGMALYYMDRSTYRNKHSQEIIHLLHKEHGDFYLIPEGGTNDLAIKGASEILTQEDHAMDYICASVGTGGTICGLIQSALPQQKVIGVSALKGEFIRGEIHELLKSHQISPACDWEILTQYHFGGYAKHRPELIDFIKAFKQDFQIPLEPIYTGKLFYAVMDLLKKGYFPKGANIMLIHSGGLQGIAGFNERYNESL